MTVIRREEAQSKSAGPDDAAVLPVDDPTPAIDGVVWC
jgi:hypothetical protein